KPKAHPGSSQSALFARRFKNKIRKIGTKAHVWYLAVMAAAADSPARKKDVPSSFSKARAKSQRARKKKKSGIISIFESPARARKVGSKAQKKRVLAQRGAFDRVIPKSSAPMKSPKTQLTSLVQKVMAGNWSKFHWKRKACARSNGSPWTTPVFK